jgi:dihydrolipoamide dehydrogenase
MDVKDYFVKIIVEFESNKILGAHIIGPQASVLIQEVINLMYTPSRSMEPVMTAMHIHPGLSEVVERAFQGLMSVEEYHHMMSHHH